jgi:hypothetical protein
MNNNSAKKPRFRLKSIIDGSFLTRDGILKQLPFILYVTLLFVIYIANSYFGEKTVYEIENTKKELIELRSEYITAKSRLMISTNLSQVSKKLGPLGVKPSHVPPNKIFIKTNDE